MRAKIALLIGIISLANLVSSCARPVMVQQAAMLPQAAMVPAPPTVPQGATVHLIAATNTPNLPGVANAPAPYRLDTGDRLRIIVFGQDGLTNSYLVDASGSIAMPLIGVVPARGLSVQELAARISTDLRVGFIRQPSVAVEVEAYRPFFIFGEVPQPGQYPYVPSMTAEDAVAIAGGFGPRSYREWVMLSRTVNGRSYRFRTPISAPVQPGDTIEVQERWF